MEHPDANSLQVVELVLRSVFRSQPGAPASGGGFVVSQPHSGTEIYFEASALLDAALFIRRNASSHLRSLSVEDLQQMLIAFIGDRMSLLGLEWWRLPDGVPISDRVSAEEKAELVQAMARSPMFAPSEVLFLYPIQAATIGVPFPSEPFFLLSPEYLPPELARWYDADEIKPDRQPPTPMHAGMPIAEVSSWLGVRSPTSEIALRRRNAILGACALLPHPIERYQFSLGGVPRGYMSFNSRATYHSAEASTPALSEKLRLCGHVGPVERRALQMPVLLSGIMRELAFKLSRQLWQIRLRLQPCQQVSDRRRMPPTAPRSDEASLIERTSQATERADSPRVHVVDNRAHLLGACRRGCGNGVEAGAVTLGGGGSEGAQPRVGQHWSKHWTTSGLDIIHDRGKYPHHYPDDHPQARSNPQESWCYPLGALGAFREWLQDVYLEGGRFSAYLKGKVAKGQLPPSVAQLAIGALTPAQIQGPR